MGGSGNDDSGDVPEQPAGPVDDGLVEITYVGDYSGLDVHELGISITRGVPFRAPPEYAARQLGMRPTQWLCKDEAVLVAAAEIEKAEAAKLKELNDQIRKAKR